MYGEVFGSTVYGGFFIEGAIPEPELIGINDRLVIAVEVDVIRPGAPELEAPEPPAPVVLELLQYGGQTVVYGGQNVEY